MYEKLIKFIQRVKVGRSLFCSAFLFAKLGIQYDLVAQMRTSNLEHEYKREVKYGKKYNK